MERIEVKNGPDDPNGHFLGEIIAFEGEDLGSYTDYSGATSNDDRGVTETLYRTKDGSYRVHVYEWSRWQGEGSYAHLVPGDEGGFGKYTEAQARACHSDLFAAIGRPNVVEID